MHVGGIIELSTGIYIFGTFEGSVFKGFALMIQSIFLLIATIWICVSIAIGTGKI